MVRPVRVVLLLAFCALYAGVATACTSTPPPSAALMARCTEFYRLWWTYEQDPVFLHTGERARAELSVYRCEEGHYEVGLQELGSILHDNGFAISDGPLPTLQGSAN
jgi:hypothetical protein